MKAYRIIFAGTPEFACPCLQALLEAQHEVIAVLTQPDRPAGRGQILKASPVKQLALKSGIEVLQPQTLKASDIQATLKTYHADLMIVVAYGLLLPEIVLGIPRLDCINVHASLLPRWRGAAPIQHAILAGDTESGVSIMQMEAGLDTGPVLLHQACEITPHETAQSLHDKLATLGSQALLTVLTQLETPEGVTISQDDSQATYAGKLTKAMARIHWSDSAAQIERQIRAFNPFPIAHTQFGEQTLRIFDSHLLDLKQLSKNAAPGELAAVDKHTIAVQTGKGVLALDSLQRSGGKIISALAWWQGLPQQDKSSKFAFE